MNNLHTALNQTLDRKPSATSQGLIDQQLKNVPEYNSTSQSQMLSPESSLLKNKTHEFMEQYESMSYDAASYRISTDPDQK